MILKIDLKIVAEKIKAKGIKADHYDWTNVLMDTLEEEYSLETLINEEFKK